MIRNWSLNILKGSEMIGELDSEVTHRLIKTLMERLILFFFSFDFQIILFPHALPPKHFL